MTVPIWPVELPRATRGGHSRTLPDGRLTTKNDAGPTRVRRRFSSAPASMQMVIDVDVDGRMRLMRFWEEDVASGSLPFWLPDWAIDGLTLTTDAGADLTDEGGQPLLLQAWLLVMFGTDQPPAETIIGNRFRISFPLTILP